MLTNDATSKKLKTKSLSTTRVGVIFLEHQVFGALGTCFQPTVVNGEAFTAMSSSNFEPGSVFCARLCIYYVFGETIKALDIHQKGISDMFSKIQLQYVTLHIKIG
jgi:hypothetical protein